MSTEVSEAPSGSPEGLPNLGVFDQARAEAAVRELLLALGEAVPLLLHQAREAKLGVLLPLGLDGELVALALDVAHDTGELGQAAGQVDRQRRHDPPSGERAQQVADGRLEPLLVEVGRVDLDEERPQRLDAVADRRRGLEHLCARHLLGASDRRQTERDARELLHDAVVQVARYPATFVVGGVERVAEQSLVDWQSRWDAYARDSGESARAAEVERTRLNFLDKQSLDASSRLNQLEDERRKMDVASLSDGAETLLLRQEETKEKVEQLTLLLDERKHALGTVQEQTRELQHQLNDARSRLQSAKGRMASLEALSTLVMGRVYGAFFFGKYGDFKVMRLLREAGAKGEKCSLQIINHGDK